MAVTEQAPATDAARRFVKALDDYRRAYGYTT
jgi:hypothetical protein